MTLSKSVGNIETIKINYNSVMKKLSVLFAAVMMVMSVGVAKAQKIASMDVAAILRLMPEKQKADQQIMTLRNTKGAEIEKQMQSMRTTFEKYNAEAPKQTQQVNDQRTQELAKLQENIDKLQEAAQKDILEKTEVAYAPIEKKFNDAVTKVAKANGWDLIVDANNPGIVFNGLPNATALVQKELGL